MILFELAGETESDPHYLQLESGNYHRQLNFLDSLIRAALGLQQLHLSQTVIKALNYHAIGCLHAHAGEYRPCEVVFGAPPRQRKGPAFHRVGSLMDDFVNQVNRKWEGATPTQLAAYVLWRLNSIHPFINGNGRTARAACYFVLSLKHNSVLPGHVVLPARLKINKPPYLDALRAADGGDLAPLEQLIAHLLMAQFANAPPQP